MTNIKEEVEQEIESLLALRRLREAHRRRAARRLTRPAVAAPQVVRTPYDTDSSLPTDGLRERLDARGISLDDPRILSASGPMHDLGFCGRINPFMANTVRRILE